jgi:hypothetical protein
MRLNDRVKQLEAKQPRPKQITHADRERWYQSQYTLGHLQVIAGTVIVNPTLETSPLHSRVLASVARAANQAGIGAKRT